MKSKLFILLILVLFLVGCSEEPTKSETTDISVDKMLKKMSSIGSVHYDVDADLILYDSSVTSNYEIWQKGDYMRIESDKDKQKTKEIIHPDIAYLYISSKGLYKPLNEPTAVKSDMTSKSFKDLSNELMNSENVKVLGNDFIDGKPVMIIEFFDSNIKHKLWIWTEKAVPLKAESIMSLEGNTIMTINAEYKNYEFADIQDSVFDVPKDKIEEISETQETTSEKPKMETEDLSATQYFNVGETATDNELEVTLNSVEFAQETQGGDGTLKYKAPSGKKLVIVYLTLKKGISDKTLGNLALIPTVVDPNDVIYFPKSNGFMYIENGWNTGPVGEMAEYTGGLLYVIPNDAKDLKLIYPFTSEKLTAVFNIGP